MNNRAPYQKINHFPGMQEICRKNYLARNLTKFSKSFPRAYDFFPKTWILPAEWSDFKLAYRPKRKSCYIVKPDHGCQGKGIYLAKSPKQVEKIRKNQAAGEEMVVQWVQFCSVISNNYRKYVMHPLLIDGFKFDLRVYVLVSSIDPLRIFIYRDGLARFATEPYSEPNGKNLNSLYMHLTNYAINKNSGNFDHTEQGSKRSIESVMRILRNTLGVDTELLWKRIGDVIVKTLIVVQPQIARILEACFPKTKDGQRRPITPEQLGSQCFEILGFDVLLDSKLKPWILEVNHSPSVA